MRRVLIADDDQDIVEELAIYLERRGWSVEKAYTSSAALGLLNPAIDALVLDLRMPNPGDGEEVLAAIRQRPELDALCVVVLTAYGQVKSAVQCMRLGAYQYLEKPFEFGDLEPILLAGYTKQKAIALRRELFGALEVRTILDKVMTITSETLKPDGLYLILLGVDGSIQEVLGQASDPDGKAVNNLKFETEPGFVRRIVQGLRMIHTSKHSETSDLQPLLPGAQSLLAVPVPAGQRNVVGILDVESSREDAFDSTWEGVLSYLGDLTGIALYITETARRNAELRAEREALAVIPLLSKELGHRIFTSLQVITGHADLLRIELDSEVIPQPCREDLQRRVRVMRDGASSIAAVCEDLQDISREMRVNMQPIDVWELVARCADEFADEAGVKGITIETPDECYRPINIKADWELLKYSLECLIHNAIEAIAEAPCQTPSGSWDPGVAGDRITLQLRVDSNSVSISVGDNGKGVPDELRDRIFDPLFSTKERVGPPGGLGLFTVKRYMRAQNGSVELAPRAGRGATFVLTLPLEQPNTQEPARDLSR